VTGVAPYPKSSKPYVRWWWFSGEIKDEDIRTQLHWVLDNGFGGVEIAWVYPLPGTSPGTSLLSRGWLRLVEYAKTYAAGIGLGCDFTIGSLWPIGGSIVSRKDSSRTFDGFSPQRLSWSWEDAHFTEPLYILNHLDRDAVERYLKAFIGTLTNALTGDASALFLDSWEVDTAGMWTERFGETFLKKFGYSIENYWDDLNSFPDVRYDYRKLIGGYVLNHFYKEFVEACRQKGAVSRAQCHGAPADILAAYSLVDVPETEAMLFEPPFARIAASAAALTDKKVVSAEAFTCIYGWVARPNPGPYLKQERISDLKLIADALFANGVNHIIWHGMPYNPPGSSNQFYATTHVGLDSSFAPQIPTFNKYMENVCDAMKHGRTYCDVAVYFPLEDARMLDKLTGPYAEDDREKGEPVVAVIHEPKNQDGPESLENEATSSPEEPENGNQDTANSQPDTEQPDPGATRDPGGTDDLGGTAAPGGTAERVRELTRESEEHSDTTSGATGTRVFELARDTNRPLPPNAKYHWEMRYARIPDELKGRNPIWISTPHLAKASFSDGRLRIGDVSFSALYIDVKWLDVAGMREIIRLAKTGLPICLKCRPKQPGKKKAAKYGEVVDELLEMQNVSGEFNDIAPGPPLIEGEDIPDFWCRLDDDACYIFFAHPDTGKLQYPLPYGIPYTSETINVPLTINIYEKQVDVTLEFKPLQSVLLKITPDGGAEVVEATPKNGES
jgi:hypothetical protein